MTEKQAVIIWQRVLIEYMGTVFRLQRIWGLALEHIGKHTILRTSIIFRNVMNRCNDAAPCQFKIAGPVDLISRLCTWLGNIQFDVDAI